MIESDNYEVLKLKYSFYVIITQVIITKVIK